MRSLGLAVTGDQLIVVGVVSPASRKDDAGSKRADYFRVPRFRHYLIVETENQLVVHHRSDETGNITTHAVRAGVIRLDPPSLVVTGVSRQ